MQNLLPLSARFRHIVVARGSRLSKVALDCTSPERTAERVPATPQSEPGEGQLFCQWLFEQVGLDAGAYRPETLLRRLPACLRELRVHTLAQARRALELEPALCSSAVSTILIGVTTFFRDPGVFTCVRDQLPLIAGSRRSIQAWSIGCSGGDELYSVALLLAELCMLENSYLLGTDCRPEAIETAKQARYDTMSIKNVPASFRARYFFEERQRWRLKQSIAAAARWRVENILKAHQPGIWDLILCRNTTMYMGAEASSMLWERFENSLRVGGLLVLGKAERPLGTKRLSQLSPCVYRKVRV